VQAVLGQGRGELELHGLVLDAQGLVGLPEVQVVLVLDGPEEPGVQARGQLHPVAVVVQVVADHLADPGQVRGNLAPVRVLDHLLERHGGLHVGDAALVLAAPEQGHLEPPGLGVEAEDVVVLAGLGLQLGGEEGAEGLAPVRARLGGLFAGVGVQGFQELERRGPDVAADPGEGIRAVAEIADGLLLQVQPDLRGIDLEIVALDLAVHVPELGALLEVELLDPTGVQDGVRSLQNVLRDRVPDELLEDFFDDGVFTVSHVKPDTPRPKWRYGPASQHWSLT